LELSAGKFYDWRQRYGKTNQHNGWVPRDFWLTEDEKKALLDFQEQVPLESYRRLTYMMIDADVAAVSPSGVFRVLHATGRLRPWSQEASKKGKGFEQPLTPHEHWHIDIAHINIHGKFYYLCTVLDGASRHIVDWSLCESMRDPDVLLQRHAGDANEFLRILGNELRAVVRDDTQACCGKLFSGPIRLLSAETKTGSAGTQPCQGIVWRTHRNDEPVRAAYAAQNRSDGSCICW
jgi:transposase InsO family protein